jgi:transposase
MEAVFTLVKEQGSSLFCQIVKAVTKKAILYLQKRWNGFTKFLTDTRIPLSNNEAERTIRHAVMGRKNYYGSGDQTAAETAATFFTIIESAKKNDIDPRTYLLNALTSLQEMSRSHPLP